MDIQHQSAPQQSDRFNSKPKTSTKQLQLHVASVYSEIAEMIKQKGDLQIQMPMEVPTALERVNLIKSVLAYLLDQTTHQAAHQNKKQHKNRESQEDSQNQNQIQCVNCQNYQKNLQKLEGQIRNHIRTHQQLKLYQDGLEEKVEEYKKQKKQFDKKYDTLKKKYDQAKLTLTTSTEKSSKSDQQIEKLRNQIKHLKQQQQQQNQQQQQQPRIQQARKGLNRYQSNKQNLGQWKNSNFSQKERTSIEKRPESTERLRVSVNARSTKGIPISSKIIQEKAKQAKQEKAKALKNRLGF